MKKYLMALWLIFVASAAFSQIEDNYTADTVRVYTNGIAITRIAIKQAELNPLNESDSLTLLYNSLALTNWELDRSIKRIRTHAFMVGGALLLEGIGAACFAYVTNNKSYTDIHNPYHEENQKTLDNYIRAGTVFCIMGGVMYVASYIPLIKSRLKCDDRGLVVSIPLQKKK